MKDFLKRKFFGIQFTQEFLCVAKDELPEGLQVKFLYTNNSDEQTEDANDHLFLGYQPVIIAQYQKEPTVRNPESASLIFINPSNKKTLATLSLKKELERNLDGGVLRVYRATHGDHSFISAFHQWALDLHNILRKRRKGNIFLKGNLLRQTSIAYSVPRVISIVSLGNNGQYNVFPSDLNGRAGDQHYLISLRLGGKACEQLMQLKACCASTVPADWYKNAYRMGKNHMQPLCPADAFPECTIRSAIFGLPIPTDVLTYRELKVLQHFDVGIHRVFICSVVYTETVREERRVLSHIHRDYAAWRKASGLPTNYFRR